VLPKYLPKPKQPRRGRGTQPKKELKELDINDLIAAAAEDVEATGVHNV
jgi:hypothetical protein